jgi:hypothetical protein
MSALLETDQGIEIGVGYQTNVSPITPITAVWTSKRFVFFPAEGDATITASTALNEYFGFVKKHGLSLYLYFTY